MFSTKGRYAIRFMIDLAEHEQEGYVPLKDIAERQEISKKYLEIIAKELVNGGLVTAMSGKNGGYKLCRKPSKYTIEEILELMEGSLAPVACLAEDAPPCPRASFCKTLPMWMEQDKMARQYYHNKKLSDLV